VIVGSASIERDRRKRTVAPRKKTRAPAAHALPPGAKTAPMPARVPLALATLVESVPLGDAWVHEIKFDGYRLIARIERGRARLVTRGEQDWTHRFPDLARALEDLRIGDAILDGEVVVLDERGVSDFQLLQNALSNAGRNPPQYFVFDLLYLAGRDLRALPLVERKRVLQATLGSNGSGPIHYCDHVIGQGEAFYAQACELGLEGVLSKIGDRPYASGRTRDWLKTKCSRQQEFVIGGYTDPSGSRTGLGALFLGVYEGKKLVYAGKVGTGFTRASLLSLRKKLGALAVATPPFVEVPRSEMAGAHWVEPKLAAEVRFTGFTQDGRLRHPTFRGLREDKKPSEIVRETALPRRIAVARPAKSPR
jgi:bifunctional non-homologous end joining protein LigD